MRSVWHRRSSVGIIGWRRIGDQRGRHGNCAGRQRTARTIDLPGEASQRCGQAWRREQDETAQYQQPTAPHRQSAAQHAIAKPRHCNDRTTGADRAQQQTADPADRSEGIGWLNSSRRGNLQVHSRKLIEPHWPNCKDQLQNSAKSARCAANRMASSDLTCQTLRLKIDSLGRSGSCKTSRWFGCCWGPVWLCGPARPWPVLPRTPKVRA